MKPEIQENKIVIFSGAGISAESGIPTYRDSDGIWEKHDSGKVASDTAWEDDPVSVLEFYNARKEEMVNAEPNKAHYAVASLESAYEVIVITQNIDNLHEKAGSTQVIHLHGENTKARSTLHESQVYEIGEKPINIGDLCDSGSQLRPHIVWFGEKMFHTESASEHLASAARVLVVGTSLNVFPAAGLLKKTRYQSERILIAPEIRKKPYGFEWLRGNATDLVPQITRRWLGRK